MATRILVVVGITVIVIAVVLGLLPQPPCGSLFFPSELSPAVQPAPGEYDFTPLVKATCNGFHHSRLPLVLITAIIGAAISVVGLVIPKPQRPAL